MKYLIVVDMQKDFITGSLGTKEAQGILAEVADKVRAYEGKVIFTRDTHEEDYLNTQEGKKLPVKHCIRNGDGWQIAEELEDLRKEADGKIFDKPTFGSVALAIELQKENDKNPIEEIELCGLCTDICVISNALLLKAFMPEVPIAVDAGCCAGVTPKSHQNALEAMKMCQIEIRNDLGEDKG